MNKYFCLLTVGMIVISSSNIVALSQREKKDIVKVENSNFETWNFTICSSYPEIIDCGQYVKVNIKETNEFLTIPEKPMLPFYSIVNTFPFRTKIIDVNCIHSPPKKIHLSKNVCPAPESQLQSSNICQVKNNNFCIKPFIDESYLEDCFSYKTGGGLDNGKHVTFFTVHFFPVRYIPDESVLEFIEYAEIEVIYEKPSITEIFTNNNSLVIITPSSFSKQLQPLVTHKNEYGISSKIATLEDIYSGEYFPVEGRDDPEKIKFFIKDALEQWGTSYILLVGDINKLPIRTTWIGEMDVLTDLYYADIFFPNGSFSSWDTNGNGRFGEFWQDNDDVVDLYADVYIGRLACKNSFEVYYTIKKIINYEKTTYDKSWFKNIILCGGDTHPYGSIYEGEVTLDEIEKTMPDFTPNKLYTSDGTFTPSLLNKAINNGAGFVAYSGHGFEGGIGTHPPNNEEWILYNTLHLLGLWNKDKFPIVYFDACLTARLDYTLGDLLKLPFIQYPLPCFAWSFAKKTIGGAIATIGATRVAFSMVNEEGPQAGSGYLCLQFFKNYAEGIRVAEMLVASQNDYLHNIFEDPFTVEEFILLGDPTLMVGGYNE